MEIIENKEKKRFETTVEEKTSVIEYIRAQDKMYLTHTEVPDALEGQGIASSMAKHALEQIKEDGLKLVPLCPFIASYVKRHPEYKTLLASGYTV
ncbi:GNAT family N-acetyltransferase [Altibacter sp.]|uniref:GNAT family N-acetyltransferase n=1 Tax=Altibacter sp. TaxID=2024823 RepID=UPI000C98A9FF|nr:GNAT family N-acetyltransferase [Altibacter sp.]MAP54263.1 GNAT family N-acetyltransferase [Altibacter sp.]